MPSCSDSNEEEDITYAVVCYVGVCRTFSCRGL